MSRFTLTNCLFGLLVLIPAAGLLAADIVPQRTVLAQNRVLDRLVGTWDTQVSGGSADASAKPTPIGRITRQWVADRHFLQELAGEHVAFIAYDALQRAYHAWYFHSNGHVWEFSGRSGTRVSTVGNVAVGNLGSLSLSSTMDENQSLTRQFQFLDDKTHVCTVFWSDENSRTAIYGTLNFTRCDPAAADNSSKNPKPAVQAKPPAEMKIFADEVGKWTLESTTASGEKTIKAVGSCLVESILGGQFLQRTITLQGRTGESIDIFGFDATSKTYRCWHFDTDPISSAPATGIWNEKEKSMAWKEPRTADLVTVSKKQWANPDLAKFQNVSSKPDGTVVFTSDTTLTRQKDK